MRSPIGIVHASEEVRITAKKITEGVEKLKISLNSIQDKIHYNK